MNALLAEIRDQFFSLRMTVDSSLSGPEHVADFAIELEKGVAECFEFRFAQGRQHAQQRQPAESVRDFGQRRFLGQLRESLAFALAVLAL